MGVSPNLGLSSNLHLLPQIHRSVLEEHEIGPNLGFLLLFSAMLPLQARGELVLSVVLVVILINNVAAGSVRKMGARHHKK